MRNGTFEKNVQLCTIKHAMSIQGVLRAVARSVSTETSDTNRPRISNTYFVIIYLKSVRVDVAYIGDNSGDFHLVPGHLESWHGSDHLWNNFFEPTRSRVENFLISYEGSSEELRSALEI